ncbi:major facilitator superfamily domain-containing protein [Cokeromyces recurvatus]|uniref:major facilitator superfamily domain-containing protein n=1 Tax=Cokeromyces recurvatus TaxID=90255 RepID=UPI002220887A|nr:major facilitator superfamily domain-containing protein [Cokeromyces recurvatus]KAI7897824.1 major facilitator superfamily domain-containing protein [Cokeromyces recurvatus]
MNDKTEADNFSLSNKEDFMHDQSTIDVENHYAKDTEELHAPPNGGLTAWLVVFGGFCGMVAEFGVNYSWGVFLNYYNEVVFPGQMNQLSWIGSICVALFFILGPVNEWVICKLGYTKMLIIGTIMCPLALMLASISSQIWHLYLTQGVMFGIGASFIFFPCMAGPQQWFTTRRGLAVGYCMCGSGVGGLIFSNIAQAAMEHLDYRWALRINGFVCFAFMIVAVALVKPPKNASNNQQDTFFELFEKQKALLKNRQFQIMLAIGTVAPFGYLTPSFYLASFANYIGLNPWIGTNLGAIMSAVNAVSMLGIGWIGDYIGCLNGFFICTLLSGVFTLAIWTTAKSSAAIWVYAVLYGWFGGGYLTMNGSSIPVVAGYEYINAANGLLYFANVFGYIFGTPITSTIINSSGSSGYKYAAVWCGVLMTVAGLMCWALRVARSGWRLFIKT